MSEARSRLTDPERARAAQAATIHLTGLPEFRAAMDAGACVAGFAAIRSEMDPAAALDAARRGGARVALPRVAADANAAEVGAGAAADRPRLRMHVVAAEEEGTLRPGRYGIAEPDPSAAEIRAEDVAVMLVPGLAFDATGNRLGFGGGYYDELLSAGAARRPSLVVGLGYDFQVVDVCPAGDGDARVDCVVTEARVIRCGGPAAHAERDGKHQHGKVDP